MTDITREVINQVDKLSDEAIHLCRSLVKINTVNPYAGVEPTGSEKAGQMFLKPIMKKMGGKIRLFEPPKDIFKRMGVTGPKDRSWKDRPNMVTEFKLGPGKRIILNSHMDTVGVGEMAIDPFSGMVKNGRIYGRGSSDDKGGMTAGIIAIKAALKFADELTGSIVHESVVDEECSGCGAGTLACCLEGYTGDEAVVVDGEGLAIYRGCQGVVTGILRVTGRSGHAAFGGVNAIDKATIVKAGIDSFKAVRARTQPESLVNIGMFHSGIQPSIVPGSAMLGLNICYAIEEAASNAKKGRGWGGKSVMSMLETFVDRADSSDPWLSRHRTVIEWTKDLVPFETPSDDPAVLHMMAACRTVLGRQSRLAIEPAWLDAANIARFAKASTVAFGPSLHGAPHSADESIRVADMISAAKILAVYLCRQLRRGNAD